MNSFRYSFANASLKRGTNIKQKSSLFSYPIIKVILQEVLKKKNLSHHFYGINVISVYSLQPLPFARISIVVGDLVAGRA